MLVATGMSERPASAATTVAEASTGTLVVTGTSQRLATDVTTGRARTVMELTTGPTTASR
jgi:hypothetical protein